MKTTEQQRAELRAQTDVTTPGVTSTEFDKWYEDKFKPAMERGPFDKYVARQAWFAAREVLPALLADLEEAEAELAATRKKLGEAETEAKANADMLTSACLELDLIREALGVSIEPHQSLTERMLEAAACKSSTTELLARIDKLQRQLSIRRMVEKLVVPARVGGATFGVGVDAQTVIEAAQRAHIYHQENIGSSPTAKLIDLYLGDASKKEGEKP